MKKTSCLGSLGLATVAFLILAGVAGAADQVYEREGVVRGIYGAVPAGSPPVANGRTLTRAGQTADGGLLRRGPSEARATTATAGLRA